MTALLAASWSAAAAGYDAVFVRQFAPWTGTCVEHLRRRAPALPADGPVWVACCGPGQELPLLHAALRDGREEEPPRRILASDLAPGMVDLAALKAAKIGPHCTAEVGDAMQPPGKGLAAIFSVFGLQQLPDPAAAVARWVIESAERGFTIACCTSTARSRVLERLTSWPCPERATRPDCTQVRCLAPGGVMILCFWPFDVERDGPWATFRSVLAARTAAQSADTSAVAASEHSGSAPSSLPASGQASPPTAHARPSSGAAPWETALRVVCEDAGGEVVRHACTQGSCKHGRAFSRVGCTRPARTRTPLHTGLMSCVGRPQSHAHPHTRRRRINW